MNEPNGCATGIFWATLVTLGTIAAIYLTIAATFAIWDLFH